MDKSFSNGAGDSSAAPAASKYGLPAEVRATQSTSFGLV